VPSAHTPGSLALVGGTFDRCALGGPTPDRRTLIRRTTRIGSTLVALTLVGCSLFAPHLQTPQLSVVNIALERSDLIEQHLKVRMRVANPNNRALPVKGITYTLDLDGDELAEGVSAASFVVPARGEAEFDMSMRANMAVALLHLVGRGGNSWGEPIGYHIVGKVELSSGWLRSIPFEQRGSLRLK